MNQTQALFCQSCGMPLNDEQHIATNKDGSKNNDYCIYCYKDGQFSNNYTMDQMIEHCLKFIDDFNKDSDKKYSIEEARTNMMKFFPTLKRWAK